MMGIESGILSIQSMGSATAPSPTNVIFPPQNLTVCTCVVGDLKPLTWPTRKAYMFERMPALAFSQVLIHTDIFMYSPLPPSSLMSSWPDILL